METIALISIGAIEPGIVELLQQRLEETFNATVEIGPQLDEPDYAYDPGRRQYLGAAILQRIPALPKRGRALGIVDVDLYAPGLNFIFGQADPEREVAIISLHRLRQELYRLPADEALFLERATKEAIHELGHTYGLGHCPDRSCVMHFSNSLADTDVKRAYLCQKCRGELWREP